MPEERCTRELDRAISALAERQHGVVAYEQLIRLGLSRHGIDTRVAARRLHRIHRGVYSVIAPTLLRREGHWKAATLAVGDGAVLSHRSAASHWGLLSYGGSRLIVTVPRRVRPRSGLTLHCRLALPGHHTTIKDAIPVTTIARTIADLAATEPERLVERAIGQAEVMKLFDRRALEEVLQSEPRRPGSHKLRGLLSRSDDPASLISRSPPEERLLSLCRSARIPTPELNAPFTLPDGTEIVIDALWRKQRLALEVDSKGFHSGWSAQVSDRHRDQQLTLAGFRPLRLVDADLTTGAAVTAMLLRRLLVAGEGQ
jgi:hypothetical protein